MSKIYCFAERIVAGGLKKLVSDSPHSNIGFEKPPAMPRNVPFCLLPIFGDPGLHTCLTINPFKPQQIMLLVFPSIIPKLTMYLVLLV